jgi:hypothetical protein
MNYDTRIDSDVNYLVKSHLPLREKVAECPDRIDG